MLTATKAREFALAVENALDFCPQVIISRKMQSMQSEMLLFPKEFDRLSFLDVDKMVAKCLQFSGCSRFLAVSDIEDLLLHG